MAASVDIEHISALVNRLLPLQQIARGDLIRAQDWNMVVSALIELAQALIASHPDAVPPHDHLEQVKLEWLDPKMKTLIQRGALADPAELGRLSANERAVADLRARLDGSGGELSQLRLELAQLSGRDLDRASQIQTVGLKLDGIGDDRDDLAALHTSLAALQDSVNVAVAVGQKLTVDGKPVDMTAMSDRLKALEGFRDGLRTATGAPLNADALANQIKQATSGLVTRSDLDIILKQRPAVVPPEQLQALGDRLTASIKADVTASMTQLAAGITAQTDQRLATIDALVSRAVGDALPSLTDTLFGKVRPEIAAAVSSGVAQLQATFDKRVADTVQAARDDLTSRLGDLRLEFTQTLRDQLQRQLTVSLEPIQKKLDDLSGRIKITEGTIASHTAALTAVDTRFASSDAAVTKHLSELTKRVDDLNTRVRPQIPPIR